MQVTFYSFTKRENSTARPGDGTTFDCILKSPSSVVAPVITLQIGRVTDPSVYNYCYIPDFDRFYWVQEWSWSSACWTAALKCDVLATYKNEIGSTSMYVLRSSAEWDGTIVDSLYPFKTTYRIYDNRQPSPWTGSDTDETVNVRTGAYVLGICGSGYTYYYAFNEQNLNAVMSVLSSEYVTEDNGFSASDASYALQLSLADPFQYIKSAMWFPFNYDEMDGGWQTDTLPIGAYTFRVPHKVIAYDDTGGKWRKGKVIFQRFSHPFTETRGEYMNASATTLTLDFPPFGVVNLSPERAMKYRNVVCDWWVDFRSGNGILNVGYSSDTNNKIQFMETRLTAPIGVPIQLSQLYHDYYDAVQSGVNTIGDVISNAVKGDIGHLISGPISGIMDAQKLATPRNQSIGSSGGHISLNGIPTLYIQYMEPVDDDLQHNGRPLCQMRTPASLGGYMLIQDGDVPIHGTAEEAAEVRSYLEGGFYYE